MSIHQIIQRAVVDGVFPSAQLLVAHNDSVVFHEAFGNATLETIFDVASLTKPISTTTLAMQLVAEDKLRLDDEIKQYLPVCHYESKKPVTIRHLLSHSSGLPAWQPYYQMVPKDDIGKPAGKEEILSSICNELLVSDPGYQSVYSDLGFILLGEIIERISKKPLNQLFDEKVAKPLALTNTFFIPLNPKPRTHNSQTQFSPINPKPRTHNSQTQFSPINPEPRTHNSQTQFSPINPEPITHNPQTGANFDKSKFAPTEDCPWRHKVMRGEVHDQNCYAMGGVAGHAGLFTNTTDINKFISEFMASYKGTKKFLQQETIERFLPFRDSLTDCNSTWLLGWDTPAHKNSQAGKHFSKTSIGHLGYTGCSMWIDISKDFWIVLLTNRVHPTTTNEKIRSFRPMLHNLIYENILT